MVVTVALTAPACSFGLSDNICISRKFDQLDKDCCEQRAGGDWAGVGNCGVIVEGPFVPPEAPV